MEPNQTTMTRGAAIPRHPREVCDGDFKTGPQSPSQIFGASPQPAEKEELHTLETINRLSGKSPSQALSPTPDPRETHIVKTTLQMRLPISERRRNQQKQRKLQLREK